MIPTRASLRALAAIAVAMLLVASLAVLIDALVRSGVRSQPGTEPTGTEPPVVSVFQPAGGERWTGGSRHWVIWQMRDEDASLFAHLYYRTDPNGSWAWFHSGEYPNSNASWYEWTVPPVDTESAAVRACATDSDNMTGCGESNRLAIDSTRPTILSVSPANGAIGVSLDAVLVTAFSEPMERTPTGSSFSIAPSVGGIGLVWSPDAAILTVTHSVPFQANTTYVWGFSCAARDRSDPGNALAGCPRSFAFTTGAGGGGNETRPDLTLTASDIWSDPPNPRWGDLVTLHARIHNVGDAPASGFVVSFRDNAICLLAVEYYIGDAIVPYLPAGNSVVVSVEWNTTASADGQDIILVEADALRTVTEWNEDNNLAWRHIYVSGTPCEGNVTGVDLTLSAADIILSDDTPDEGQTVYMWAYVHNVGSEDAWNVTVRFADCLPFDPCTDIGYEVIPHIPAGSFGNASAVWTAGPVGRHDIVVTADPLDTIRERDETNNVAVRSVFVGGSPTLGIFVQATTFDNDNDGRYDDVVILVYDSMGRAVEGAAVYIDGVFHGLTADTGLLVLYNFAAGDHSVLATWGPESASTTFRSDG